VLGSGGKISHKGHCCEVGRVALEKGRKVIAHGGVVWGGQCRVLVEEGACDRGQLKVLSGDER
jgi:hypothetical protein